MKRSYLYLKVRSSSVLSPTVSPSAFLIFLQKFGLESPSISKTWLSNFAHTFRMASLRLFIVLYCSLYAYIFLVLIFHTFLIGLISEENAGQKGSEHRYLQENSLQVWTINKSTVTSVVSIQRHMSFFLGCELVAEQFLVSSPVYASIQKY